MSVTYYYETANGLTAGATSTTSGSTVDTNEMLVVTSGSSITSPILVVSAVDLTGSGSAASQPAGVVYNGGSATVGGVTEALSGGIAVVQSGGAITSGVVNTGGGIFVEGGATSGSILSGGFEDVLSGGVASGTSVSAGVQGVYGGGVASSTTIFAGGSQVIHSGGLAISGSVDGYGHQDIMSGGTVSGMITFAGGVQTIQAGGQALADISTGEIDVYGYDAAPTVSSGGVENVMSGGVTVSAVLTSGGSQVVSGGTATAAQVLTLGVQTVMSGGTAVNTVLSTGTVNIQSDGMATGLQTTTSGGTVVVSNGGTAKGSVLNGGLIEVQAGGTVSGTVLNNAQELLMGGTAIGTDVRGGGSEVILSGTANGTTLESGGSVVVYANGTVQNLHVNGAGVVALDARATVIGDIVLSGSGATVQFTGATLPSVKLDGLAAGDKIDLFAISGGASASYVNGELVVTNASGATIATIDLGTVPNGVFSVGKDTGTGTLITVETNIQTAAAAVSSFQAGTLSSVVTVSDSAANVTASLNGLESIATAGKLGGIALTDSGYANIAVTAATLSADSAAIKAISGNFILSVDASSASNATIAGLANHPTVVGFSGSASQYTVAAAGDGVSVTVSGTAIGTDHVSNATMLKFSDVTEVLVSQTPASGTTVSAADIAGLYAAALGRAPDAAGLSTFENILKTTPGVTGATAAGWFLGSPEYAAKHTYAQTTTGDTLFINDLYNNVLNRAGSAAEVSSYLGIINQFTNGKTPGTADYAAAELAAHAAVLFDFGASAELRADLQVTAQHPAGAQHWLVLL